MRTVSLPLPQMEGEALCRLRTIIRREFEMTPKWNAQHPNGKQGFQPPRHDNRHLDTPGIHHSSPPHGRQRLHTDGDNAEQPQNGRLAFRGRQKLHGGEEVTKREEWPNRQKRNRGPALPPPGWRLPRTVRIPSTGCLRKAWLPPCRFCVQTARQRGCSPWLRLRPRPE